MYISRYHPNLIDLRLRAPHVFGQQSSRQSLALSSCSLGNRFSRVCSHVSHPTGKIERTHEHLYLQLSTKTKKRNHRSLQIQTSSNLTSGLKLNPGLAPFICVILKASFGKNLVIRLHIYCLRWGPIRN